MTTVATSTEYDQLIRKMSKEVNSLGATISLLHWDQEVMMPKRGIEFRADQISLTSRMHHEMLTDPKIGEFCSLCESDSDLSKLTHQVMSAANFEKFDTSTTGQQNCLQNLLKRKRY